MTARNELLERYTRLGLDPAALHPGPKGTIAAIPSALPRTSAGMAETLAPESAAALEAATEAAPETATEAAPAALPTAVDPAALIAGRVVGEGGMGIVQLAEQVALRREVAVKRVRPERMSPATIEALLREAWVTGALEHPNVVPIHLLVEDDGAPVVVMKRIEGVTWSALLDAPELARELAAGDDLLAFHLRVLGEVCRAVHFAHSRGVLHLDLKPDNVMVGHFGEVYVVDWGIAARLPGGPEWLPAAAELRTVRGTPTWLAPEVACADGAHIGVAADVYLLGGLLHAILTHNAPRHGGQQTLELLIAAYTSAPYDYDDEVPDELAQLANRATARVIADRPASAEAFRRAIESYLAHRHSTEIGARAAAKKDALLAFFERAKGAGESTQVGQTLRRDFLEARFGFRQALEIWPENARARDGLQALLRAMARFALDNEQLERAAESVAELSPRDPVLEARLKDLAAELADRHERLVTLERDASIETHRETRSLLALGAAILYIVVNAVCGLLDRSGVLVFTPFGLVLFNAINGLIAAGIGWWARRHLLLTATNRRLLLMVAVGFVALTALWLGAAVHGRVHPERALTAREIVAFSSWGYSFFTLGVAVAVDRRAGWLCVPVTIIAALAPLAEQIAFEIQGLQGFLIGAWLAWLWRRRGDARPAQDKARRM